MARSITIVDLGMTKDWVVNSSTGREGKKEKKVGYVDTDPDPSPDPGARRLRRYWTRGPGAAKIGWGTPGDFNRCVTNLREHVGEGAEGLCNIYHTSATGFPPGKHGKELLDRVDEMREEK